MINITQKELEKLEKIDSGNFAQIYRFGNLVYKIYKPECKARNPFDKVTIDNPELKHKTLKLFKMKRLLKLDEQIKHTSLIKDIIYIDDSFAGVVYPYYEGESLNSLDIPFEERINLSHKIIQNAKELTDHNIYPTDYAKRNIILVNEEIQLIDLDDVLTKVHLFKNKHLLHKSVTSLDRLIQSFLKDEFIYPTHNKNIQQILKNKPHTNETYKELYQYLNKRNEPINILLFDANTPIETVQNINQSKNVQNILIYKYIDDDLILQTIQKHNEAIFTAIPERKINSYLENNIVASCLYAQGKHIQKLI